MLFAVNNFYAAILFIVSLFICLLSKQKLVCFSYSWFPETPGGLCSWSLNTFCGCSLSAAFLMLGLERFHFACLGGESFHTAPPLNFEWCAWHCQCHQEWYELEFKQVVPSGCCHRGWDHTFILSPWWICLTLSNSSWLWSHIMKSPKIESGREQRGALIIYWLGRIHTFCKETSFVVGFGVVFFGLFSFH